MKNSWMRAAVATAAGAVMVFGLNTQVLAKNEARVNGIAYNELVTLTQVMQRVREAYVEPVDDSELLKNAIRGMLEGLDPHSAYLDEEDFQELNVSTSGQFGGLGIEVTMQNGFVKVVTPIDDTPAEKAGVEAGDLIIRLDDKPVKGMSLRDAVKVMRGEPGSDIIITVVREGEALPFDIKITRDIIKIKSVKQRMLDDGFGYLRITQFQANTGRNMGLALDELEQQNGGDLKGLVLDLRNNPGGVLTAAVHVSEAFLDGGLVVYIQGREKTTRHDFNANRGDELKGAPIVVLINEGSASASEIVAGALQDRNRAVVMGRQSFGKGSVQTIMSLNDQSAIKLTTARYYTPSGRSIQADGIHPDIEIDRVKVTLAENAAIRRVREADLSNRLENDDPEAREADEKRAKAIVSGQPAEEKEEDEKPLAEKDYELYEALNLLKGIAILGGQAKK